MTSVPVSGRGIVQRWNAIPLYLRILLAMIVGAVTGLILGEHALVLEIPSKVILQLLGALAPPLILVAETHVLMTTELRGKMAWRLAGLLLLNTTVNVLGDVNVRLPARWARACRSESRVGFPTCPSFFSGLCLVATLARA